MGALCSTLPGPTYYVNIYGSVTLCNISCIVTVTPCTGVGIKNILASSVCGVCCHNTNPYMNATEISEMCRPHHFNV